MGYMGAWRGRADYVSMYVSVGEKEVNHRYNINEVIAYKAIRGGVKIVGYVLLVILNI